MRTVVFSHAEICNLLARTRIYSTVAPFAKSVTYAVVDLRPWFLHGYSGQRECAGRWSRGQHGGAAGSIWGLHVRRWAVCVTLIHHADSSHPLSLSHRININNLFPHIYSFHHHSLPSLSVPSNFIHVLLVRHALPMHNPPPSSILLLLLPLFSFITTSTRMDGWIPFFWLCFSLRTWQIVCISGFIS